MIDLMGLRFVALDGVDICGEVVVELIDRAIAAESERDDLKAKLAEMEKQEPAASRRKDFMGNYVYRNEVILGNEPLYAQPKPSTPIQHITEQDVRDIVTTYANYLENDDAPIADFEWYSPELQNSIRAILAKLNEHRWPLQESQSLTINNSETVEPYGYIFENKESGLAEFSFVEWKDRGKWFPIYREVTANKEEVPSHIDPEPIGFVGSNGDAILNRQVKGGYLYWGDAPPLPPLKDSE